MADEDAEMEQVEQKDRQGREEAAALNKMSSQEPERQMDENRVAQAMKALAASQKASREAQLQREKELAAVKLKKEDIDVVAAEFELDKKVAERRLRECGGDLVAALKSFL